MGCYEIWQKTRVEQFLCFPEHVSYFIPSWFKLYLIFGDVLCYNVIYELSVHFNVHSNFFAGYGNRIPAITFSSLSYLDFPTFLFLFFFFQVSCSEDGRWTVLVLVSLSCCSCLPLIPVLCDCGWDDLHFFTQFHTQIWEIPRHSLPGLSAYLEYH